MFCSESISSGVDFVSSVVSVIYCRSSHSVSIGLLKRFSDTMFLLDEAYCEFQE